MHKLSDLIAAGQDHVTGNLEYDALVRSGGVYICVLETAWVGARVLEGSKQIPIPGVLPSRYMYSNLKELTGLSGEFLEEISSKHLYGLATTEEIKQALIAEGK